MDTAVRVHGLVKRFRKTTAVDSLAFEVPRGSVFALLGNNGAGKTTTIRCLLGLEAPDAGDIEVMGMDPRTDAVGIRRRVGYVPEERHLYPWMTAREIGWFVGSFYPTWSKDRYGAILDHFEIPARRKIAALSRGMKAQVDLALALGHDPDLLVLDEPTGGLDPVVRRDFLESMVGMAGQGRTVIVSSHEVSEVARVADRGLIVYNSRLLWTGDLESLGAGTCEVVLPSDTTADQVGIGADTIIHQSSANDHVRLVVRGEPEQVRTRLAVHPGAVVKPLGLEEIFVAHLYGAGYRSGGRSLHQVALTREES